MPAPMNPGPVECISRPIHVDLSKECPLRDVEWNQSINRGPGGSTMFKFMSSVVHGRGNKKGLRMEPFFIDAVELNRVEVIHHVLACLHGVICRVSSPSSSLCHGF